MRKVFETVLILLFLILSSSSFIGSSFGSDDIRPMDGPISEYPQQDGGSEDRLFQYRSMWMDGYQIVNISEIRSVVQFAREYGFNCVSPNINGHYLGVFYNSSFFPKYPEVHWSFDPLMELIKEAHKYNIHVMPWFHTMYNYPALINNPDWRDRSSSGSYSGYWMDPANDQVRDFLVNLTKELFNNYPLDGIKLDTIRYGGSNMGYTDISIQKYYDEGWSDFGDFRRNQITEVVELIYGTMMDIRPWAWVGADIWHAYSSWYSYVFQDSRTWASLGIIDFVTTMSYTTSVSSFSYYLDDNLRNFDCEVVAGPYVYVPGNTAHGSVPDEATGISILLQQTEAAFQMGSLGTCMFAYKFLKEFPSYARALRDGPFSEKALCPLKKQTEPTEKRMWGFEKDHDTQGWRTTSMGQYFPIGGKWSVVNVRRPGFMSPLLEFNADGINVLEIMMRSESGVGNLSVYWSFSRTVFDDSEMVRVNISNSGDWHLYSIHMDSSRRWNGGIGYLKIVPWFTKGTNITIDSIRLTWMPDCIKTWSYLGPFHSGEREDLLDRDFIGEEGYELPKIGDVIAGREWKPFFMARDEIDLGFVIDDSRDFVVYSHVYIRSDHEGVFQLRLGNSDGAKILLNGKEVHYTKAPRRSSPDQNISFVSLERGINTLLMKHAVYGDQNSFFIRFTTIDNKTLEKLEFFQEPPRLNRPDINWESDKWTSDRSPTLTWTPPMDDIGLDHFDILLDGTDHSMMEMVELQLDNLPDGIHSFSVRCVDNLGFSSDADTVNLRIDTRPAEISTPISSTPRTNDRYIEWTWKIIDTPISGIQEQYLSVYRARFGSEDIRTVIEDRPIAGSRFRFTDELWNGYVYYLSISTISGSGLLSISPLSSGVLVDLTPPSRPSEIALEQIELGSRKYLLSWTDSVENIQNGMEHYEVWIQKGAGNWELFRTTNRTTMIVERPLGMSISLKVRAKDRTSLLSGFTDVVHTVNEAPRPEIIFPLGLTEGAPIEIRSNQIVDPDGEILLFRWFLNEEIVSMDDQMMMTLVKGTFKVELWVMDDQGEQVKVSRILEISEGGTDDPDKCLKGWLIGTSNVDRSMPPVNITIINNRTIPMVQNDSNDDKGHYKQILADGLLIILTTAFIVFIVILSLFIIVHEATGGERIEGSEKDEDPDPEEDAYERRRRMLETIFMRTMAQNSSHRNIGETNRFRSLDPAASRLTTHYGPLAVRNNFRSSDIEEDYEEWDHLEKVDP